MKAYSRKQKVFIFVLIALAVLLLCRLLDMTVVRPSHYTDAISYVFETEETA